jgi:ABC-type multidrug transport system fused ATPase/permease subunit
MRLKLWMVPTIIAMVVFVLFRCRWLASRGLMTIGTFVSIILVVLYMLSSLTRLVSNVRGMVFHWGVLQASAHLFEDCGHTTAHVPSDAVVPSTGYGCIGVRTQDGAVRHVDLHFELGERLAITGSIGSGKSTLLRLLVELIRPSEGVVYMHGLPYTELSVEEVRKAIGYVPQSPSLFDRSILENIKYGNESADEGDIWQVAGRLGISDALREIGLHTLAGKGGSRLSGGQRQLVWIIRVMLRNPEVLMLDEPTSALDDASAGLLARLLVAVPTVVMVTHDTELIEAVATRVVRMDGGVLA